MDRIKERDLVIPALITIRNNPGITTSEMIKKLQFYLNPSGKDNQKIKNRKDTYFSQKVRNLKSHDTLSGFTLYDADKGWHITQKGLDYLNDNIEKVQAFEDLLVKKFKYDTIIEFLHENTSSEPRSNKRSSFKYFDEDRIVEEGKIQYTQNKTRKRSAKLRSVAIEHFKNNEGKLKCSICGFDFEEKYGELGKDFIEIHHVKPIYSYSDEDTKQLLSKILDKLMPVCSNCHRMIHRMNQVDEDRLKKLIHRKK
ncbi:MAG: HNH endonuclease [archaeon]